jgi:hypothetical protein
MGVRRPHSRVQPLRGADARAIAWSGRWREARTGFIPSPVPKCEGPGTPGTWAQFEEEASIGAEAPREFYWVYRYD